MSYGVFLVFCGTLLVLKALGTFEEASVSQPPYGFLDWEA